MFQTKFTEEIKTHILGSLTFLKKNDAVYEICALETHTQNVYYFLLLHCNNGL